MSTRCSIVFTGKLHIYSCCNSGWDIFIADGIADEPREGYNDDIKLGHKELRDLYDQLKKYFDDGAPYESYLKSEQSVSEQATGSRQPTKINGDKGWYLDENGQKVYWEFYE